MYKRIIAVLGATGQVGGSLTMKLLKNKFKVRAIGRDSNKLSILKEKGAEIFQTDFQNISHVMEAFSGVDGVFVMIPPAYGEHDQRSFQDKVGEIIKEAINRSNVKKVVSLSSFGAQHADNTGPITGLHNQEERLKTLQNVDVLNLRAAFFMQNLFWYIPSIKDHNEIIMPLNEDLSFWMVSATDIGKLAADYLSELSFKGNSIFEFAGPQKLTMIEVTNQIANRLRIKNLKYIKASYEDTEKGLILSGMNNKTAKLMVEMYKALNDGLIMPTQLLTGKHLGPTSFEYFTLKFAEKYKGQ